MTVRSLIFAATMTALWLFADWYDVKVARLPGFPYELQLILLLVFLGFVLILRSVGSGGSRLMRAASVGTLAAVLTAVWFAVTTVLLLQFHVLAGGHL